MFIKIGERIFNTDDISVISLESDNMIYIHLIVDTTTYGVKYDTAELSMADFNRINNALCEKPSWIKVLIGW